VSQDVVRAGEEVEESQLIHLTLFSGFRQERLTDSLHAGDIQAIYRPYTGHLQVVWYQTRHVLLRGSKTLISHSCPVWWKID